MHYYGGSRIAHRLYVVLLAHFLQALAGKGCHVGNCDHDGPAHALTAHPLSIRLNDLDPHFKVFREEDKQLHGKSSSSGQRRRRQAPRKEQS